jgi:hypothetical protein
MESENHMPLINFLLFVFVPFIGASNEAVRVIYKPQQVYIERGASAQHLNFDFVVENLTGEILTLSSIEVSVFDGKNKLVLRKFADGNGTSPSIRAIPNRELEVKTPLLIFNPFHSFAFYVELTKLHYTFSFEAKDQKKQYKSEVTVTPLYYETKTNLILPLKGKMIVYDGHDFYAHHRRFDYMLPPLQRLGFNSNFMRYSYDFCPVNERGEMYRGTSENNEAWFGFGMPVFATGDGQVVAASDGMPDNRSFAESALSSKPMTLFGNYVVIHHGNGEYSVFGHLKEGSLRVKVGETITRGQQIAQIGASGSANIPHLHYELQNGMDTKAEGLPSYFRNFRRVLGSKTLDVEVGQVDSGDIVQR